MVFTVKHRNNRKAPQAVGDPVRDLDESRKYQSLVNDDVRDDLRIVSSNAPDLRDRISHKSTGETRQRVAHNLKFVPEILSTRIIEDSDEVHHVNEWKDADSKFFYLKTNAPRGARIVIRFAMKTGDS